MYNRVWRLDADLSVHDNVLDGFTFESVIDAVRCERFIDKKAVLRVVKNILESQLQDMNYLIDTNMDLIITLAKKGRDEQ